MAAVNQAGQYLLWKITEFGWILKTGPGPYA
jgi:hypothetical protein